MDKRLYHILFAFTVLFQVGVHAQQHPVLKLLDSLIAEDGFKAAQDTIAYEMVSERKKTGLNLGKLIYPLAKTEYLLDNQTSFPKSQELLKLFGTGNQPDSIYYEALLGLGLAHVDQGSVGLAKGYIDRARTIAYGMQDVQRMVTSEFHMGELEMKLGNIGQLMAHTDRALWLMNDHPKTEFRLAPRILNYKASLMHFMAKPDSANYYFERAIRSINPLDKDPEQLFYLPGTIYGNWTMVKQSAGDYDMAMELTIKSISNFNVFLQRTHNHPLTEKVRGNLSIAYRNLGSIYNDLGDKEKAIQVATLGYNHAKKYFLSNTVQHFSAVLMMAEAHLYGESMEKAKMFLEEANASLVSVPGDNWSYVANLFHAMADLAKKEGNLLDAITNYQRTLEAYSKSSADEFSQNIIFARINLAQVYAGNQQYEEALELIERTYFKVAEAYGESSYLTKMVQLSKIRIYFIKNDFESAIELCQQLLDRDAGGAEVENRSYLWSEHAEILMYLAKSKLGLLPHTQKNLKEIAQIINEATAIVEKRKSLVTSQEGVGNLIADNEEIFALAKKVYLALYDQTKNEAYLEKVMALHESSIYNRIRARLNLADNTFVPNDVQEREHILRHQINTFFDVHESDAHFDVRKLDSLNRLWRDHLGLLKKEYPKYYRMRYASIVEPLKNLKSQIPPNTTLVRYFSDSDNLYAYIYSEDVVRLVKLGRPEELCISAISDYSKEGNELFECLYQLYQVLWKPLENLVQTENIIVFPDGELYNLSFELLTSKRIKSYRELATESLLAKYSISYNYSLFMLHNKQKVVGFKKDFIAFVPEFDKAMKEDYQMAISDSLFLDKTYLTLLPQPFSSELVKKFSRRFDGSSFLNERASKPLFTQNAKEHKIIHIGTHAESNNVSPELSRLVFAKNVSNPADINDNYLYTYEIYDQNLSSHLAILTACETGKPTYQPGEGMISLAHAFNYAGSESVLTSLWQIDEKSSNELLESFYGHLSDGKAKHVALRLAKLEYLNNGQGRTLHPQYWAGLVLMGDTAPIELQQTTFWPFWVLIALIIIISAVTFLKKLPKKMGIPKNAR